MGHERGNHTNYQQLQWSEQHSAVVPAYTGSTSPPVGYPPQLPREPQTLAPNVRAPDVGASSAGLQSCRWTGIATRCLFTLCRYHIVPMGDHYYFALSVNFVQLDTVEKR